MAASTLHGHGQEHGRRRVNSIGHVFDVILFFDDAAFGCKHVIAAESCSNALTNCGIRKQVAGDLFCEKLVVRHSGCEGIDHPISPWPHGASFIVVVAVGVGIASCIQPLHRHAFAIVRRLQQSINDTRVDYFLWRSLESCFERIEFFQ